MSILPYNNKRKEWIDMGRRDFYEQERKKKMVTTFAVVAGLAVIAFVTIFVMYSQKLNKEAQQDLLAVTEQNENLVSNDNFQATSFSQDKTVEDTSKFSNNTIAVEIENTSVKSENVVENKVKSPESKEPVSSVVEKKQENVVEEKKEETAKNTSSNDVQDTQVELQFQAPVAGDIIKDFAMETLVYSETLGEWCTHSGIDIKADKSSVVAAAEKGTVESIKNDPRYGLTIIISHADGFKTVYSNLLTTEFVQEGEEVEKGQTIATVGESASFEVADESHLHFEMYKDNIAVNPTIYFK